MEHPEWALPLTEVELRYRPVWSALKALRAQPGTRAVSAHQGVGLWGWARQEHALGKSPKCPS